MHSSAAVSTKGNGDSLANYERIKLLGKGSFGSVFLMRRKKANTSENSSRGAATGALVCVKCVSVRGMNRKERESAQLEVRILRKLEHPNIVPFRSSFLSEGGAVLNIVLAHCDGGDLEAHLKALNRRSRSGGGSGSNGAPLLSEGLVLQWFAQVALGLHFLHANRVLHRDIKSANVFVTGSGRLVLGDFGISKVLACAGGGGGAKMMAQVSVGNVIAVFNCICCVLI